MKKFTAWMLLAVLLAGILPAAALAEKSPAMLDGRIGFMYEDTSANLNTKIKNADKLEIAWASSDTYVATVENGIVNARKTGKALIRAACEGKTAYCGVVVLPEKIELSPGESFSLPCAAVEKYAVQHGNIAKISSRGKITALSAGETLVRVKYGKQSLYIQLKIKDDEQMQQSAAANLDCADSADQIILVEHEGGSKATLSIHEKKSGVWTQLYACSANIGRNGIGKTREGDGKTPSGTYNLCQPFGIKENPGANMEYTQATKYHYWCGTSGSPYYNQLVDMRETDRACTSSDEYLIDYRGVYNYCMFIDYNAEGEAGKGSCIFLHCSGSKNSTSGCIAVPEEVMKKIIRWAQPGVKIVIQ